MSYKIFKDNMLSYMRNQRAINSKEEFATKLVQEYDALIKRGYDTINGIKLNQGNTEAMYNVLVGVLNTAFQQSSGEHAIITNLGPAFQAYWTATSIGGSLLERVVRFLTQEEFDETVDFKPEELECAIIASDKGYAIPESTAIGTQLGGEVIKGNLKIEDVKRDLPDAKRKPDPSQTNNGPKPELSEKITDCGNVRVAAPNALLIDAMKQYGIITPIQRAHFLAQLAHETANFYYKEEIASGEAYEGRKSLGNTQPGDGRRFKGRGYIQLTGRANYTNYNAVVTNDVIQNPSSVATDYYADVAGWFWKRNKINDLAIDDTQDSVLKVSIRINGKNKNGLPNGWDDRKKKFCGYWTKLKENPNLYT